MKKVAILVLMAIVVIIPGCKKYEDGPMLSFRSKMHRVVNSWRLDAYYLNGVEATSSLIITGYTEDYTKAGSYSRSYTKENGDLVSETGSWEFDDKKDNLLVNGVGSIELSNQNSTVTNTRCTILRLKEKELWYEFENGGDKHEFHFVEK